MPVSVHWDAGTVVVGGELSGDEAADFGEMVAALRPSGPLLKLRVYELDLVDGKALLAVVDALRDLLGQGLAVELTGAPQLLAHTLYRAGLLEGGHALYLVAPRQEEPYG